MIIFLNGIYYARVMGSYFGGIKEPICRFEITAANNLYSTTHTQEKTRRNEGNGRGTF